jgi:hypothetical protein
MLVDIIFSVQLSGIVLGYRLDEWWFESRQRLGIFLLTFPWGAKRPGREADHPPPSSTEVKE